MVTLEPWANAWYAWVSAAFLDAYRTAAGPAGFLPSTEEGFAALLQLHLIDKCCYELSYELNNRPAWVGVPMAGLISLAGAR